LFVASRHDPSVQTLVPVPNVPGGPKLYMRVSKPVPRNETWGTLTAVDLKNGGRALWQVKTSQPLVGGTVATAGGLVFAGEPDGRFSAYDSTSGTVLWTRETGATVGAPPMSYSVNGRQFIAVATGSAASPNRPGQPGAIRAFALPQ
jgi:glucose dehydrogenase